MECTKADKKLRRPFRLGAVEGSAVSRRLHIRDAQSGLTFLIDTGSDVSIILANSKFIKLNNNFNQLTFCAANNSKIRTFGTKRSKINFNLRRDIVWSFLIAEVPYPIIGADFLSNFKLTPVLHESCLIDTITGFKVKGIIKNTIFSSFSLLDKTNQFSKLLSEFPELTSRPTDLQRTTSNYHIGPTAGPTRSLGQ